jgi:choline dehydrogenase-like flavoprotein
MPADAEQIFDACVVGSGAGGGAAAYALCRAGLRVVVLEKGPLLDERQFLHDELGVCRRPFFVPSPLEDPNVVALGDDAGKSERTADGWISSCVGGGTVHMAGYFFRMRPEDFRMRTLYGRVDGAEVADWPFSFEEMAPFYAQAEDVLGLSGDPGAPEPGRRRPYPLGPLLSHPAGSLIDRACARVGLHPFRVPRAIVSADYRGRPACHYCRFCASYGCEVGAKSSSLSTFLALARATGRLTLRPGTTVVAVEATRAGGARRASGVVIEEAGGVRRRVRARVVVLAASSVQTARLLLLSELANGSGLVGKNLMFVAQAGGWGRFALPSEHFPPGSKALPFIDRATQDHYLAPASAGLPHPKAGTLLFQLPHANPIFQSERLAAVGPDAPPLFGAALKRRMREFFRETRTIEFEAFAEWLPSARSHVTLDPEVKDARGRPVARITAVPHPATVAAVDFLAARGRAVLEAAGTTSVGADPPRTPLGRARAYPFLQAGTARMGTRPAESVLDPTGQAHDVRNLYVADASGFPSAGGAPHTLTIMANALRVAAAITARR